MVDGCERAIRLVEGLLSPKAVCLGDCRVTSRSSAGAMGPCSSKEVHCFDALKKVSVPRLQMDRAKREWGILGRTTQCVSRRQTPGISVPGRCRVLIPCSLTRGPQCATVRMAAVN